MMQTLVKHRLWVLGAIVVSGAVASGCVPPPPPPPPVPPVPVVTGSALWAMDDTTGTMKDSVGPPFQNGIVAPGVSRDGSKYHFPGWQNNVDAAGNLVGVVSATDGQVTVADPQHLIEPKNGKFKISGVMQSALASTTGQLPNGVVGQNFNVIQKARSVDAGGFWKVEIGTHDNRRGALMCTLGDGDTTVTAMSPGPATFADGQPHSFACWLNQNTLVAELDGQQGTVDTSQVDNVDPSGRFSTEVTFGKKPGSTDPEDSFAGWLYEVQVSIG
jgi:hypothetical protein